jgi:hypothetical protein
MPIRSERRFISLVNVKPGMIVQFNYTKLSGESASYTVLVIDPNRKNDHARESQLHAYDIRDMDDEQLVSFLSNLRKRIQLDPEFRRESLVEDLNSEDAYEAFVSSRFKDDRPYRTFNLSKISQLRQVLLGSPD